MYEKKIPKSKVWYVVYQGVENSKMRDAIHSPLFKEINVMSRKVINVRCHLSTTIMLLYLNLIVVQRVAVK